MTGFIVIIVVGLVVVVGITAAPLILGRGTAQGREEADAQVFRDQLAEVERDLARGAIGPDEAEGARIEVSRRLLKADRDSKAQADLSPGPKGLARVVALVVLISVPALALGLYAELGQPGLPGQPLAERMAAAQDRPSQEEAEAEANLDPAPLIADTGLAENLERLEQVVAGRPDDPEGQRLMGITQLRAGRYVAARKAFDRYMELADQVSPAMHASHAEAMILGAGGYVSPEAGAALEQALRKDPSNQMARYYAGIALAQAGRLAQATQLWQRLRSEVAPDSQVAAALDALLAEARQSLPGAIDPARPGPSQADVDAAQNMTPEERAERIASMLARFEDRLTSEGGDVEDWVRLMGMYVQQERPQDARRVYEQGVAAQAEQSAKSFLKEQALLLGLDVE